MKFVFIVQGEGRGHLTQAISMAEILRKNGHKIVSIFMGKSDTKAIPYYFTTAFDNTPVEVFKSPHLVNDKNDRGLNIAATFWDNLLYFRKYYKTAINMAQHIQELDVDRVINFYEILGGVAARHYTGNAQWFSIAHQFTIEHPRFQIKENKKWLQHTALRLINRITSPNGQAKLGLSFQNWEDHGDLKITPPLIRSEVKQLTINSSTYILAYAVNAGYAADLRTWQLNHPKQKIIMFTDKAPLGLTEVQPNFFFHSLDGAKFLHYMSACKAYASTAGFESICEAFYLGKPILMKPTDNHYEQACNAIDAENAGAGMVTKHFNLTPLIRFANEPNTKDYNKDFKKWVDQAESKLLSLLCQETETNTTYFKSFERPESIKKEYSPII